MLFAITSVARQNNAKLPPVKQGGAAVVKPAIINLPIKQGGAAAQANSVDSKNTLVPVKTESGTGQKTGTPANNVAQNNKTVQLPSAMSTTQAQQQGSKATPAAVVDPQTIMQKQAGDNKEKPKQ